MKASATKSHISDYLMTPIMNENNNQRGKTTHTKINNWESLNTMTSLNSLSKSKERPSGFNAYTRLNDLFEGKKEVKKKPERDIIFDLSSIKRANSNSRVTRNPSSEDLRNSSVNSQSYLNKSREVSVIYPVKSGSGNGSGNLKLRKEIETFR